MSPVEQFVVRWASATHAGHHREENEDSFLTRPPIFVVADGMGGHERGQEASARVVRAFESATTSAWLTLEEVDGAVTEATVLVEALSEHAHDAPGSTVSGVGLTVHEGRPSWLIFNIGDSRTYRMRGFRLEQVTVDHSELQEMVDSGVALEQAQALVPANVITRAIGGGMHPAPVVDQWLLPANVGDRMLVCSDGLTDELNDHAIASVLVACTDPHEAAHQLVDAALDAGGRDNVTVVVVEALTVSGAATGEVGDDTVPDIRPVAAEDLTVPDLPVISAPDGSGSLR